jgi:hypothetical protein
MMWYCRFTWYPGVTSEKVRRRVLDQHAAGTNHPEKIRGWYNLAGGGAGFMLIETDDPHDLTAILEPYMDLVKWDVHAVYELPYEQVTEHFRERMEAAIEPTAADQMVGAEATS